MPITQRFGFFFYGTLMNGTMYGCEEIMRVPAFVDNAIMVTSNGFPAMVLNRRNGVVKGVYVEVETTHKNYDRLVSSLDQWESCHDNDPVNSMYLRTTVKVRLQSNREVEALAYYLNTNENARWLRYIDWKEIPNGDWQAHYIQIRR